MINGKRITAVVPVRAGSTRIKNKNIKKFADSSLLEIKINQLKRIPDIDEIIVSSDSKKMLKVARDLGVIPKERPIEYCDEKSKSFNDVVKYIAIHEVQTDIMMWTPCVCPCIKDETFIKGIDLYKNVLEGGGEYDSVVTSVLIKEYLFDVNGPVNFSVEKHVKSQNLPDWHYVINGFFIARTLDMAEWGFVYGKKPYLVEVDKLESIDIDDKFDFDIAEYIYNGFIKGDCK